MITSDRWLGKSSHCGSGRGAEAYARDDVIQVKYFHALAQPFVLNVLTLAGGSAGAQAITMLFAPAITRLYGPEAFGTQGMFLSLVSMLTPLAALAYPSALVLAPTESGARSLVQLSVIVSIMMATGLGVILFGYSEAIVAALGLQAIEPFLFALPVVVLLSSSSQVTEQWLVRDERFAALARVSIAQSLLVNAARVGLGLISATATTLVAITTVGIATTAAMNFIAGRRNPAGNTIAPSEKVSTARMAFEYRYFPLYRAPEMLLAATTVSIPILVLATAFGPASAGFYALARSVLYLPVSVIGNSVAQVFYPRFNRQVLAGEQPLPIFLRTVGVLALIGLPIFGAIALFGPRIFLLIFGAEWLEAGVYARWLSVWLFCMFINRPCISVTSVLGMQRMFLVQGIFGFCTRFTGLWIGWQIVADDVWAIALFGLGGGIAALALIAIVAYRLARMEDPR